MSDSGFVDDAPRRAGRTGRSPEPPSRRVDRRRVGLMTVVFGGLAFALVALAVWAWSSRVHADDVAAFEVLRTEIDVMDRSLTPQRHSEIPPCRDRPEGIVTRTYPGPNGPSVNELLVYLKGTGWADDLSAQPAAITLTRNVDSHGQSLTIVGDAPSTLALSATSDAGAIGCLLR